MRNVMNGTNALSLPTTAKTGIWIALIVGSSILFSLALACATPFAALGTVAGTKMVRRDAIALVIVTWLANQLIGYFILGYPRTWDSFARGAAIGVAAILATFIAIESTRWSGATLKAIVIAFLAAFITYEGTLYAATALLPSSDEAFSL
jgi:hypothetical protein